MRLREQTCRTIGRWSGGSRTGLTSPSSSNASGSAPVAAEDKPADGLPCGVIAALTRRLLPLRLTPPCCSQTSNALSCSLKRCCDGTRMMQGEEEQAVHLLPLQPVHAPSRVKLAIARDIDRQQDPSCPKAGGCVSVEAWGWTHGCAVVEAHDTFCEQEVTQQSRDHETRHERGGGRWCVAETVHAMVVGDRGEDPVEFTEWRPPILQSSGNVHDMSTLSFEGNGICQDEPAQEKSRWVM